MYPIEAFLQHTPRVKLMPAPTPLHPLHTPAPREDVSLWIKRDDMTGIGPGGNKIRSLEFRLLRRERRRYWPPVRCNPTFAH